MEMPTISLSNTTAIVTGGTRNIGASISRVLAERGANVAMVYRDVHNSAAADAFARELTSSSSNRGNRVVAIQADMADPASPTRIIEETRAKIGVDKINIIGLSNIFPQPRFSPLWHESTLCTSSCTLHIQSLHDVSLRGVLWFEQMI